MKKISLIRKYLLHWISARNTLGHGVHSPYMFYFIRYILNEKYPYYVFKDIEKVCRQMPGNKRTKLTNCLSTEKTNLADWTDKACKQPKLTQMLFRIIRHLDFKNIFEIGTSLGIHTMYMASVSKACRCITMEPSPELSALAQQHFDQLGLKQIKLINCDVNAHLEAILKKYGPHDFIFIGHYKNESLMPYFELCMNYTRDNAVIVINDIHLSPETEAAWENIKKHPLVKATIDIFYMGIVFLNPVLAKKHYVVRPITGFSF